MKTPDVERLHVLLVEDNPGDADLVREALQSVPRLDIAHVEDVATACERIAAGPVDVVLLDLSLPDAVGLEGVEIVHRAAPELPIVVLTSTDDDELGTRVVQAGAQDYLVKGQTAEWMLVRALRYAVERHLLQAERARMLVMEQAARVKAEAQEARMTLLAEVSAQLADALDDDLLDAKVAELAALAVPRFADCCIIERLGLPSSSDRLTVRHVDPDKEQIVRDLYRDGLPVHDGNLLERGQDPHRVALLQALAPRERVTARLRSHDKPLGAITFLSTAASERAFDADDRTMIDDLAGRLSVALENAHLYHEVRRATTLRDEFVSMASHVLRTPVAALVQQLGLVRGGVEALGDAGGRQPLLASCGKAVDLAGQLERLVQDLLDVAAGIADRLALDYQDFDLRALVREVTTRFGDESSRVGSALEIRPGAPVMGRWDRPRVQRLVANLVSNALAYGAGKPVIVDVSAHADRAELTVRDHGIGMAREDMDRIFERFERAVPAPRPPGLGLGLHISREIARAHGGTIDVKSDPGQGSLFRVTLPLAPAVREGGAP